MTAAAGDTTRVLVLGTRGSALARAQTAEVQQLLEQRQPTLATRVEVMTTRGDRDQGASLATIGGQGVFVKELQAALLAGSIDAAVHSLKDLPPVPTSGLRIAAFAARADPRDALVSRDHVPLAELPAGGRVGTGSARRRAFILDSRPDLDVRDLRGNVDTRLRKLQDGECDAVVLAAAGLARLGRLDEATEVFPPDMMIPAPGQGILAVEAREDDQFTLAVLSFLDERGSRLCALAERGFLNRLGAGCSRPAAAYAVTDGATIDLRGALAGDDGRGLLRRSFAGPAENAASLGASLAAGLLAARGS